MARLSQSDEALRRARVLDRFPAGDPRGERKAAQAAADHNAAGIPATVVLDGDTDFFIVKAVS